jgi:hypothetical protein
MTPTTVRRMARRAAAVAVAAVAAACGWALLATPPEAAAQPAGGAPELALVPADAAGFVHVRAADIWKSDLFTELRKTWERAGAKAIADLDKQFVPAPSSFARATGFVVLSPDKGPLPYGVVAFSAPFQPSDVAKSYLPNGRARKSGGKTIYTSPQAGDVALYFPDNKTIVVSSREGITEYLSKPVAKDGPLAGALKLAAGGKAIVAAANLAALPIPPGALNELPPQVQPLLKAELVTLVVDLGKDSTIAVKAGYPDAAAATAAEGAVRDLAKLGRGEIAKAKAELEKKLNDPDADLPRKAQDLPEAVASVFGLGALGRVDDLLADDKLVTRDGKELSFVAHVPKEIAALGGVGAVGAGFLLPAVQKVRSAAGRASSQNNLKQIGLAVHNFHDVNGRMPANVRDKTGKAILSWRVEILPYIEQQAVFQQVKMDEPWDRPANKNMAQVTIKTVLSPNAPIPDRADGYGLTNYRGVNGKGMAFDPTNA